MNFTELLGREYAGKLGGDADRFISYSVAGTLRIEALLKALLAYWEVSEDATELYTADRLAWIEDWYIRDTNYTRALASIVKLQGQIPLASQWGDGKTSSSDGQAFPIGFRKPVIANINAKYES